MNISQQITAAFAPFLIKSLSLPYMARSVIISHGVSYGRMTGRME
jgi:hypothetical protein